MRSRRFRASHPVRLIVVGGAILIVTIVAATALLLANLRQAQIEQGRHDLESLTLLLAEQIDRGLRSIEVIQDGVIERVRSLGIATADELARRMADRDTHQNLKDRVGAVPHIDALVLTGPDGRLINFSRHWPPPAIAGPTPNSARVFHATGATVHVGEAVQSPTDGRFVLPIARKIVAPDGAYLGALLGVIKLSYFEQLFGAVARSSDRSISLFVGDAILVVRHPRNEDLRGQSFAHRIIFRDVLSKAAHGTVRQVSMTSDRDLLISGRRLPNYPMTVVATKRLDDVLAAWRYAAFYVAAAAIAIVLMIAGAALLLAWTVGSSLKVRNRQLDAALNNMSQGLAMFDAGARLVVCNERYMRMYDLPPEAATPGCPLQDTIRARTANGIYFAGTFSDPDRYVADLLRDIGDGKATSIVCELADGRTIAIANQPMAGGGWVATHDDITDAKRREASFRLMFENNPVSMWIVDCESLRFLAVNNAAVAHYGYSRDRFMAMTTLDVRPAEERERVLRRMRERPVDLNGDEIWRHRKADGRTIEVCIYARAFEYDGRAARMVAVHDITDRRRAEEQLRRTEQFLDMIFENVPVPIAVKEIPPATKNAADCPYTLVNRAFEELLGLPRDRIVGKTVAQLFPKDRAAFIAAENNDALNYDQPVVMSDHPVHTFTNGVRIATAKSFTVRDDDRKPRYLLTVLQDVTERRSFEQRLARMAHHDNLTDLPNRITFNDELKVRLRRSAETGEPFAVLSLDLDGFKEANDRHGHSTGDALLCETARRLEAAAAGAFVARLGGDEFALIVSGAGQPEIATAVGERVLEALKKDVVVNGHTVPVGATVGGAVYPKDGTDAKTLMLNADVALYRAKAEARGSLLFFDAEMGNRLRARRALLDDLRGAVERNELLLHYQPQKKISGETVGFEALVRWRCPKRGLVPPGEFIPISEEAGTIGQIGEWVLREACREAASWPQPLTIAVNISPLQFRDGSLPKLVHAVLLETGLSAARLELEITEGVLVDNFSRAMSILARLKSLGVRVALDDFGTGYSSLSYLHAFSFDKIKLDRAFIGDLDRNPYSIAIVRAVIDLGHSLDTTILAEGVETAEQHAALFRKGCDEVQGYLTGRPLPIEDYAGLVGREVSAGQDIRRAG